MERDPLPSIADLGRRICALGGEADRLDEEKLKLRVNDPRARDLDADQNLAWSRVEAYQALIATLPARTLGDAVVQLIEAHRIIWVLAENAVDAVERDRSHTALRRLAASCILVVASAAGLASLSGLMDEGGEEVIAREFPDLAAEA